MKMAVYRPRLAMLQMELADCYRDATNVDHVELINMAIELDKPVLIGFPTLTDASKSENVIVKPFKPGDDVHSYESLLDNTINVADLQIMRKHDVKDPNHIPSTVFHVEFDVPIAFVMKLACEITARDGGELRSKIAHLETDNVQFNKDINHAVLNTFRRMCEQSDPDFLFKIRGITELKTDDADPPEWRFVDPF